ncbi:hypothetical protein PanWU01x14_050370, partial [Parasponia andersonii]
GDNTETGTFVSLDGAKKRPFLQSYLLELMDEKVFHRTSFGAFTAIDSQVSHSSKL